MTSPAPQNSPLHEPPPPWTAGSGVSRRVALLTVATVIICTLCLWAFVAHQPRPGLDLETHTVDRGDVVVCCTQPATVESATSTDIACEVETATYGGYRQSGAEVLWIAPDSTIVKKGDLLVELNDTLLKDLRDDWQLKVVKSEGDFKQADIRYQNQLTKRETELANALAQLESAESLESASEGIRKIKLAQQAEEVRVSAESVKAQRLLVKIAEAMDRIGDRIANVGTPQEERYRYQVELMKLGQSFGDLEIMKTFNHPLQAEEIGEAVKSARRALLQSQRDHAAEIEQLDAQLSATAKTLSAQRDRLQQYEDQVSKCTIHAPHDGIVIYASGSEDDTDDAVAPGAVLRERQKILTLHDLSVLQLRASLPAADVERVQVGMPVAIAMMPDDSHLYDGTVTAVQRNGPDSCAIIVPHNDMPLRLGAAAHVEIQLGKCTDVVRIPLQACLSRGDQTLCYVMTENGLKQRVVKLGAVGTQYGEVVDGLEGGEMIALSASAAESPGRAED